MLRDKTINRLDPGEIVWGHQNWYVQPLHIASLRPHTTGIARRTSTSTGHAWRPKRVASEDRDNAVQLYLGRT